MVVLEVVFAWEQLGIELAEEGTAAYFAMLRHKPRLSLVSVLHTGHSHCTVEVDLTDDVEEEEVDELADADMAAH